MESFDELLARTLQARPGLTRERLAAAMAVAYDDDFRDKLSDACDRDIAHKVQDKYYPGTPDTY